MIDLYSIEVAIRNELLKHEDLADFQIDLEEAPPEDIGQYQPGWIGIYIVNVDASPNTFGPPGGGWEFEIQLGVILHISGIYTEGSNIFAELSKKIKAALNVLFYDLTKGGTIESITDASIALDVLGAAATDTLFTRDAAIQLTCIVSNTSQL